MAWHVVTAARLPLDLRVMARDAVKSGAEAGNQKTEDVAALLAFQMKPHAMPQAEPPICGQLAFL